MGSGWEGGIPDLLATLTRNLVFPTWHWRDEKCWGPVPAGEMWYTLIGNEGRGSPDFLAVSTVGEASVKLSQDGGKREQGVKCLAFLTKF